VDNGAEYTITLPCHGHTYGLKQGMNPGAPSLRQISAVRGRPWIPILCSVLWLGTTVAAMAMLWLYENVPGPSLAVPATWPEASAIPREAGMATLVMFAHPRCPCTRASIGELANVIEQSGGRVRAHVVFYRPAGSAESWLKTDLWRSAAAIPGVEVRSDEENAEAGLFGAATSGFVVLYDAEGRLEYSGGITGERGHSGDNLGEDAVIEGIKGQKSPVDKMPVLGCSLYGGKSACLARSEK